MPFEFRVYALPFLVSAIISLLVALVILQRQNVKGSLALALLMLQFALWAGADFVRWSLIDVDTQVFWLRLSHAVFVAAPLTFLIFVSQLTGQDRWLARPYYQALLALEPVLTMLVIATNDLHNLFYASFRPLTLHGFAEMGWRPGPWFWVNTVFSYLFLMAAAITLVRGMLHAGPYARVQLITVLIGCVLPWGINAFALLWPGAARNLEVTPLVAAPSGLIFYYALFRQRLLDIVPVARGLLFEKLTDGVLVLDANGRVLDVNVAARRILHLDEDPYGMDIWEIVPHWRSFGEQADVSGPETHFELESTRDPSHFYDVSVIAMPDGRGRENGRIISLRDITARKQAELELNKMNLRLQRQVEKVSALHDELKEQAIRDGLTGLFNRRYLDETLDREFSRARRASYVISIIMMDIDEFKRVNDTYGHKSGDRVLTALGEIIRQHVRAGDIPCRYGGEEFAIVLPETSIEIAVQRAEQIRQRFHTSRFFKGEDAVVPTLSIGIASYPAHGRSAAKVMHAADVAMYAAKSFGGNKAVRYDERKNAPALPPSSSVPG